MKYFNKEELITQIEKDINFNWGRIRLLNAYNRWQEDEKDGVDYIFHIDKQDDLISCVNGGMTSEDIVKLRKRTNAGMMDCKNALTETNGDLDKATEWLREKGIAKAAKKADRIAAEGLVAIELNADNTVAAVVEIDKERRERACSI